MIWVFLFILAFNCQSSLGGNMHKAFDSWSEGPEFASLPYTLPVLQYKHVPVLPTGNWFIKAKIPGGGGSHMSYMGRSRGLAPPAF